MSSRVVLITGASSGIGEALAREYGRRGFSVALSARRQERLASIARAMEAYLGARVLTMVADVRRDGDLERVVEKTRREWGRIDIVVANAGFSVTGGLEELALDDYRRQFETNVFGVLRTVYAALDALKASRGVLGILGSVAGYVALPGASAYSMSKFALRGLCDSLASELSVHGVSVSHVAPGFVESEIRRVNNEGELCDAASEPIPSWFVMPRDRAAKEIVRALDAREREVVLTRHGKVAVWTERHVPNALATLFRVMGTRIARRAKRA